MFDYGGQLVTKGDKEMICDQCSASDIDSCNCWELEAATYRHENVKGQIRRDELRDKLYGPGRSS
jgi:hypothetical protein